MSALRFAGYAAIFDRVDKGGDIIRVGAFGDLPTARTLPLLWQHDPLKKIGEVAYLREDRRGLRVIGFIDDQSCAGQQAQQQIRDGSVRGLSFGYRVRKSAGQNPRELLALDVAEISLVTHPMQLSARLLAVEPTLNNER